jgi:hypothetical protein
MGKVFRDSARRDQKALDRHKAVLHQLIPQINRRHHDTLDEVEIELVRTPFINLLSLTACVAENDLFPGHHGLFFGGTIQTTPSGHYKSGC